MDNINITLSEIRELAAIYLRVLPHICGWEPLDVKVAAPDLTPDHLVPYFELTIRWDLLPDGSFTPWYVALCHDYDAVSGDFRHPLAFGKAVDSRSAWEQMKAMFMERVNRYPNVG